MFLTARCPVCKKPYNFTLRHRFVCDWSHLCSFGSIHNSFELCSLLFTTIGIIFTFSVLDLRVILVVMRAIPAVYAFSYVQELRAEAGSSGMVVLGIISIVCLAAVALTLLTVFRRWKASTSDVDLVDSLAPV